MSPLTNKMISGDQLDFVAFNPEEMLSAQNASWDESIIDLRGYFQIKTYSKRSTLYSIGDSLKEIHILRHGRIHLTRPANSMKPQANHVLTEILSAGQLFGNKTLAEDHISEETALAIEDAEVWSIGAQEFTALLASRPVLAIEFYRIQSLRVSQQARYRHWLTTKDVPERLASTLLVLADLFGETVPMKSEILVKGITQQDLADLVGASRSFVSTLINLMKQDGYLFSIGRNICIPCREKLALLSGEMKSPWKKDSITYQKSIFSEVSISRESPSPLRLHCD